MMSTVSRGVDSGVGLEAPLFIRVVVPNGLEETLEDLTREVLRHRPKNIYEFAAKHFAEKLEQRDGGK